MINTGFTSDSKDIKIWYSQTKIDYSLFFWVLCRQERGVSCRVEDRWERNLDLDRREGGDGSSTEKTTETHFQEGTRMHLTLNLGRLM